MNEELHPLLPFLPLPPQDNKLCSLSELIFHKVHCCHAKVITNLSSVPEVQLNTFSRSPFLSSFGSICQTNKTLSKGLSLFKDIAKSSQIRKHFSYFNEELPHLWAGNALVLFVCLIAGTLQKKTDAQYLKILLSKLHNLFLPIFVWLLIS